VKLVNKMIALNPRRLPLLPPSKRRPMQPAQQFVGDGIGTYKAPFGQLKFSDCLLAQFRSSGSLRAID
jgi:hypothetical protein